MKSYTDLSQSKKLTKFLPIESADMKILPFTEREYRVVPINDIAVCGREDEIPCWSLAALLSVIPYNVTFNRAVYRFELVKFSDHWECYHENFGTVSTEIFKADNPVDACYEMIIKLHEQKIL